MNFKHTVTTAERSQAAQIIAERLLEIIHDFLGAVRSSLKHWKGLDFWKRGYPDWEVSLLRRRLEIFHG